MSVRHLISGGMALVVTFGLFWVMQALISMEGAGLADKGPRYNLDFVRPESLADSLTTCLEVFEILEQNRFCRNLKPKCEPRLGKRGLYEMLGPAIGRRRQEAGR